MDCIVYGVAKSGTLLSDYITTITNLFKLINVLNFEDRFFFFKVSPFFFFKFYFIFKLYITVLVLPNIKMNPPQVYMCSPS